MDLPPQISGWSRRLALTIELITSMSELAAHMELFGPDGWKTGRRSWSEEFGAGKRSDHRPVPLPQVISEWTGLPIGDAEALVAETVEHWRGSPAYERELKLDRLTSRTLRILVGLAVLTLAGLAGLVWLIVSVLT
jgi:hypothetical protein